MNPTTSDAAELVRCLPDIVFGAPPELTPGLEDALARLAAMVQAPADLVDLSSRAVRAACGEGDEQDRPSPRPRILKCHHNHVSALRWRDQDVVQKLYGNPWGCVRECAGRIHAARAGLPGVSEPLCVGGVRLGGRLLAAAVFPWEPDAPESLPPGGEREFGRALGRWARRLHDSLPASVRVEREGTPFSLRNSRLLDLSVLLDAQIAPEGHWRRVEELLPPPAGRER